ncbi:MAG TPA: nuclear transport factor 2 family protein [Silvibacterium sp.]|nr:nuclear transport factor 2 family protein [Silvibacterium sp.]
MTRIGLDSMSGIAAEVRNCGIHRRKTRLRSFFLTRRAKADYHPDTHMRRSVYVQGTSQQAILQVLLIVAICMVLAHPAFAMPRHENHAIHKEIEALEEQWRQAVISNDVTQMDHLLSDDYIGISANGTVETKAQALALRKAGTVRIKTLEINDLKVRVYGDTAVVTSRADLEGTNGQSDISGKYRYTRVYNHRFGQWKIVSFEASRMHDVDARH